MRVSIDSTSQREAVKKKIPGTGHLPTCLVSKNVNKNKGRVHTINGINNETLKYMLLPDKSSVNHYDVESLKARVSLTSVYQHLYSSKFANQKKGGGELLVSINSTSQREAVSRREYYGIMEKVSINSTSQREAVWIFVRVVRLG